MIMSNKKETLRDKIFNITGVRSTAPDWESYFHYLEQNGSNRYTNQIVSKLCDVVEVLEKELQEFEELYGDLK